MKKIISIIGSIMIFATMTIGCSDNSTKIHEELINKANSLIEEKYEVIIDKNNYTYGLGKVLSDNQFIDIKEDEIPEEVFLRGTSKDKPSRGEVFNYSIRFNPKTDEIISSECEVY